MGTEATACVRPEVCTCNPLPRKRNGDSSGAIDALSVSRGWGSCRSGFYTRPDTEQEAQGCRVVWAAEARTGRIAGTDAA